MDWVCYGYRYHLKSVGCSVVPYLLHGHSHHSLVGSSEHMLTYDVANVVAEKQMS